MKKGIQRFWAMLRGVAAGIVFVTRYPRTDRSIRIMLGLWAVATLTAVVAIVNNILAGAMLLLCWNLLVLTLDVYMLRHAILGLRYRRSRRGKVSRRALP